ncbi:MAG: MFS transporter [Candidatus Peribacteraceae bacterium]|nr:MFS transporter [Candidatus Peribacteraceae bacterium]
MNRIRRTFQGRPLPIIFFTVFLDLVGIGILIPVVPLLLADPASPEYILPAGTSVQTGYILLGLLIASYPLCQFLATPVLGQLSDKYGRRSLLLLSLLGTALSYVLFAYAIFTHHIPLLFLSRAFDGITGGNIAVAQAAVADISTRENRARSFGIMGTAFGLGFILGPAIGGLLSSPTFVSWFNAATPFWFAALLSAANAASVWFFFPETNKQRRKGSVDWVKSFKNIAEAYALRKLRPLFATQFLFQAGFTFFTTFASVFLINRFGFTQASIGNYVAYLGIWIAFTQAVVIGYVSKRFPDHIVVRLTVPLAGVFIAMQLLTPSWWWLLLISPFFAVNNGLSQVLLTTLVSKSASAHIQGEVLGVNASVQALGQSIPPILSGFIAAILTPATPVFVGSILILLAGAVFALWFRPLPPPVPQDIA